MPRRTAALTCLLAGLVAGCNDNFPGKPNPADRPLPDDRVLSFDLLYRRNCAGCHGADGRLGPAPPLNDPTFLAIVPDAELLHVIREGRRGTPMPAFARDRGGSLTAAQVSALAMGIKLHWKAAAEPADAPPAYRLTNADDLESVPGDRDRGADLFARVCAECHGANGKGPGGKGDRGNNAIDEPAFLALISDQALRRIIITGRPDLGMPTFAENDSRPDDFRPLTSPQIDDLVALLAAWRVSSAAVIHTDNP